MKRFFILSLLGLSPLFLSVCTLDPQKENSPISQTTVVTSSTAQAESSQTTKEEPVMPIVPESLLHAVTANDLQQVQELLKNPDYPIDEQNEAGETPLMIATHLNQLDIAKTLIDHGADINQQDGIQDSPYLYASAQGKTEILDYMLKNGEPDQQIVNRFGGNALIPAAEKGHLENVKLLLADERVNIDHQNNYGYTALIEAVALRDGSAIYQEIVQVLLDNGANKELRDNYGKTAEDYARELGYSQLLTQLTTTS
ncbi:ankyrin repeat domain-containing protein [Enterococcus durans]|uniref:ankyrin repeat domain-containing protein n=1 Tax=Enterococcus durans TaxID=53345 RepID=UPI0018847744|nr:ankyrin repeat domain-containing protein [Enterococcus durans]MBE9886728.1 ankyrin repeat domain-containing protein [Enterococcus durans]